MPTNARIGHHGASSGDERAENTFGFLSRAGSFVHSGHLPFARADGSALARVHTRDQRVHWSDAPSVREALDIHAGHFSLPDLSFLLGGDEARTCSPNRRPPTARGTRPGRARGPRKALDTLFAPRQ